MTRRLWIFAAPLLMVALCGAAVAALVAALPPAAQSSALGLLETHAGIVLLIAAGLLLLLFGAAWHYYQRHERPLRRLAEETRLLFTTNPGHRIELEADAVVANVQAAVNAGAERMQQLSDRLDASVERARAEAEHERHLLASLVAEITEGVVVCTLGGEVLLYNAAARELLGEDGDTDRTGGLVGLGRSIFSVIGEHVVRHALDEVERRLDDEARPAAHVAVPRATRLLRMRVLPVRGDDGQMDGFLLVLTDVTEHSHTDRHRDQLIVALLQGMRSHLGGLRAAIENLVAYPDLDPDDRVRFEQIVHDAAVAMSRLVERTEAEAADLGRSGWSLDAVNGLDLLQAMRRKASRALGIEVEIADDCEASLWVEVDSYAVVLSLLTLIDHLSDHAQTSHFVLRLQRQDGFAALDLTWTGSPVPPETLRRWGGEPVAVHGERLPHTLYEVVERHGAETWARPCGDDAAYVRLLLPALAETAPPAAASSRATLGGRPIYYDFNLLTRGDLPPELDERLLTDLAYTVFDTETTGLQPSEGDEIISIGAARIVNGRMLDHEVFDQLVDPRRPLALSSMRVHGIQPEMLQGQPTIGEVLPRFHRFAEGTVLVGHNIAFDLRFLQLKERAAGVRFDHPLLDTMLLAALVYPSQDDVSLDALAPLLGVDVVDRHTALGDARTTAGVFLKLIPLLRERGLHTLGAVRQASSETSLARLEY